MDMEEELESLVLCEKEVINPELFVFPKYHGPQTRTDIAKKNEKICIILMYCQRKGIDVFDKFSCTLVYRPTKERISALDINREPNARPHVRISNNDKTKNCTSCHVHIYKKGENYRYAFALTDRPDIFTKPDDIYTSFCEYLDFVRVNRKKLGIQRDAL